MKTHRNHKQSTILSAREAIALSPGPELDRHIHLQIMRLPLTDTPPPYSTNLDAAATVVSEMHKRGWVYELELDVLDDSQFRALFGSHDRLYLNTPAVHPSQAAAICLAAIHADSIHETECDAYRKGDKVQWAGFANATRRTWTVHDRPFEYLGEVHLLLYRDPSHQVVSLRELQAAERAYA
jgi:hypothetical protein